MKKKAYIIIFLQLLNFGIKAQQGKLSGTVKDQYTNEPIPFAAIVIYNTSLGTMTDTTGRFEFSDIEPGFIQVQASSLGYLPVITEEINISAIRPAEIEIYLESTSETLNEVKVTVNPFLKKPESPVSLRRIGIDRIEKSAGANRDISKVLQSFPGVGSSVSFRNDLIVRGGGPSENRFFLDGIEIPVLNHFTTQGASGGPTGILNVDFIREVDFYSSAFPAGKGNALSSVFDLKLIDGNKEKTTFKGTLGASETALSVNTPLSDKTAMIASVRHSYLQFLFDALGLPFLPTFTDFQFKTRTRFDKKNELTLIGVGAYDQLELNPSPEPTEENAYILGYLPVNNQWNYTLGAAYKHYLDNSYYTLILSRNHLYNEVYKYKDNVETDENLSSDYSSNEIENKLRFEYTTRPNNFTINTGAGLEFSTFTNNTFFKTYRNGQEVIINYENDLNFMRWFIFGSVSHPFLDNRLILSTGLRMDANNYSQEMNQLYQQISPRFSASYRLNPKLFINLNTGRYYQQPTYTTMAYRNNEGELVNKSNGLKYLYSDHYVGGFEMLPNSNTRITLEGFYKQYNNYPFSVKDSISMASKGGDFGIFGDEEVTSTSKGKSYGMELLIQQNSPKGYSYTLAYTLVRSLFTDIDGEYLPSSWDSKHLFTFTFNKKLKRNWDFGFRWRYVGGLPYTPYDYEKSALVQAWDANGREYLDYSQFNTQRLDAFHQLDLRIDKFYSFKTWSLGLYLDIQNLYNWQSQQAPVLVRVEDENGPIIENPNDPIEVQRYRLKELQSSSGTVLPTIGLVVEF
jgi:hypothetical protein